MAGDSPGASQMIGSPSIFRGSDTVMDKGRSKDKESGPVIIVSKHKVLFHLNFYYPSFLSYCLTGLGAKIIECVE